MSNATTRRAQRARRENRTGTHRQGKIVTGVGIVNTGVALASWRFEEARIPMITAVATGSIVTRQFRSAAASRQLHFPRFGQRRLPGAMIVEEAIVRRKFRKVAILADSTNCSRKLGREDLERALDKDGHTRPVAVGKFNIRDIDRATSAPCRLLQGRREALLTYGIGPELAQIANSVAASAGGCRSSVTGRCPCPISSTAQDLASARMPQTFVQEADTPRRRAFIEAYQKISHPAHASPSAAARSYDAMMPVAAAIRQAGTTFGSRVRALQNLEEEKVDGVVTTYDRPFSRDDHGK
ncbi:MAG: ABC transporter substrate-binding protein [Betaproteobacteria bacterium]|nr:ABC transporter substrate-binding protein [Betaproteobacteria bacterium]